MTQDDPRRPAARSALSRAARPLLRHPPRARRRRARREVCATPPPLSRCSCVSRPSPRSSTTGAAWAPCPCATSPTPPPACSASRRCAPWHSTRTQPFWASAAARAAARCRSRSRQWPQPPAISRNLPSGEMTVEVAAVGGPAGRGPVPWVGAADTEPSFAAWPRPALLRAPPLTPRLVRRRRSSRTPRPAWSRCPSP